MNNFVAALREFGLSGRQAEIYLALRKRGRLNVTQISRLTGIPRVSVYSCLDEMQRLEIISRLKKNNRQIFEAHPPLMLLDQLKRKSTIFESIVPLLQAIAPDGVEDFAARVYQGHDQSRRAQIDLFEQFVREKVKLVHSISHPDLAKKFPRFLPMMIERRREMGIATRLLVSATQRALVPLSFKGRNRELRYLPGRFPFNCTCVVGGSSTLFILTQHKEPSALLIQSKSVSQMIFACLAFIWEVLPDS